MAKFKDEKFLKTFGEHLRLIRLEKRLTQSDLAFQADIPISQVGRIERGIVNPSITTVYLIAKTLQVPIEVLFEFEIDY